MAVLNPTSSGGIYIHIPFCIRKCLYCDFYSTTDLSLQDAFIKAILREIDAAESRLSFDSLYLGGGTPSILPPRQIGRIMDRVHRQFRLAADAEITLEVNPGTVSRSKLAMYRQMGVNRLNIGVQSFQDPFLKWLGRAHSAHEAKEAIRGAESAGFKRIGLDLIYGIPGQTRPLWVADLHQALSMGPEHLSCYMLTCEPGTPLDHMRQQREYHPMPDDDVCDLFETTVRVLAENGYSLYEISNFARNDGFSGFANRSRHNAKYWTGAPYLGFGPAAHSYLDPVRCCNHRNIADYLSEISCGRSPIAEKEILSTEQQLAEMVFLGLRTAEGISIGRFEEKSGRCFRHVFQDILTDPELKERIRLTSDHCRLTFEGMMVLDAISEMFIDRIDFHA